MESLLFKKWLLYEFADFGFDYRASSKIQGGTEVMPGDGLFKRIDGNKIINELSRLPSLGQNYPNKKFNNIIEWGEGPGAIQVAITPLGALRILLRRRTKDLQGENTWICEKTIELSDVKSPEKEISIAHDIHKDISEMSLDMIPGPDRFFDGLENLSRKMWIAVKKEHPSYCLFPTSFRKQNENYYKLVFEFRGHGVQKLGLKGGRAEQYNIDILWDEQKGLIKCMGYEIDSTIRQHTWTIQPVDFSEYFSPQQEPEKIIRNVIEAFIQY